MNGAVVVAACAVLTVVGVAVASIPVTATVTLPALTAIGLVLWGGFSTFLAVVFHQSRKGAGK